MLKEFIKCKYRCNNRKCETCAIKYKNFECFLEHTNFKDNLIKYKHLCCNKNYPKKKKKKIKNENFFFNVYNFSNHDINKFVLLLRKGVYPYEYIDD